MRASMLRLALVAATAACLSGPASPAADRADRLPTLVENSIGMRFVLIPAGRFRMGSDESVEALERAYPRLERDRLQDVDDEAPAHEVRISRQFYLGQHEVTVGQFRRFVEASGYTPESQADGTGAYGYDPAYDPRTSPRGDAFDGRNPRYSWRNPGFAQDDEHPVVNVTWNDAMAMAKWLGEREGRTYRLPTEAEWEYACRAGTGTRYHSGNEVDSLLGVANIFDADSAANWPQLKDFAAGGHDGYPFTAPVGRFRANDFGLHDMHGNAWEWVADWYDRNYYARSSVDDPKGPAAGSLRVRRGGSWHTWPFYARSTYRNWNTPETRYTLVGMRLLLEADGQ